MFMRLAPAELTKKKGRIPRCLFRLAFNKLNGIESTMAADWLQVHPDGLAAVIPVLVIAAFVLRPPAEPPPEGIYLSPPVNHFRRTDSLLPLNATPNLLLFLVVPTLHLTLNAPLSLRVLHSCCWTDWSWPLSLFCIVMTLYSRQKHTVYTRAIFSPTLMLLASLLFNVIRAEAHKLYTDPLTTRWTHKFHTNCTRPTMRTHYTHFVQGAQIAGKGHQLNADLLTTSNTYKLHTCCSGHAVHLAHETQQLHETLCSNHFPDIGSFHGPSINSNNTLSLPFDTVLYIPWDHSLSFSFHDGLGLGFTNALTFSSTSSQCTGYDSAVCVGSDTGLVVCCAPFLSCGNAPLTDYTFSRLSMCISPVWFRSVDVSSAFLGSVLVGSVFICSVFIGSIFIGSVFIGSVFVFIGSVVIGFVFISSVFIGSVFIGYVSICRLPIFSVFSSSALTTAVIRISIPFPCGPLRQLLCNFRRVGVLQHLP